MRLWLLFLGGAVSLVAQPFSVGIKAGVPLSDFVSATQSGTFDYTSQTQRYIIGGTAELRLPLGFAVEFDAMYRHLQYSATGELPQGLATNTTTAGNWEFPLLLKYRFAFPVVRPYVDGGVAWDALTGLKQTVTQPGNPFQVKNDGATGFVLGGGIDIHAVFVHISPELRYTRWFSAPITDVGGLLRSGQNQAEFLVGFTF
jgi:Outer membrane protein beta-barrel domain